MRQRLAIARGLLTEPDVLFMDEPTRSLDPITAREVRGLVQDHVMARGDRAVILATHSMSEAEALCDRVAFVRRGEIVAAGPLRDLRATIHPGRRVDLTVRGSRPRLMAALPSVLQATDLEIAVEDDHLRLRCLVDDGPGVVDQVLRAVMAAGGEITECRIAEATLEELFVQTLQDPPGAPEVHVA